MILGNMSKSSFWISLVSAYVYCNLWIYLEFFYSISIFLAPFMIFIRYMYYYLQSITQATSNYTNHPVTLILYILLFYFSRDFFSECFQLKERFCRICIPSISSGFSQNQAGFLRSFLVNFPSGSRKLKFSPDMYFYEFY